MNQPPANPENASGAGAPTPDTAKAFYEAKAAVYRDLDTRVGERDRPVLELLPRRPSLRVCDAGCGSGRFLRTLKQLGHDAIGIDISEAAVKAACESGARAVVGNPETGAGLDALGGGFDVVTALDLLEHTFDPAQTLRRLTALLKPDGCLIVSVPNVGCLPARLTLLAGRFPARDSGIFDSGHVRWFTKSSLPRCVADAGGLRITAWRGTPLPTLPCCGLWRLERPQLALLRPLANHWPSLWAYQLVVKLERTD